MLLIKNPPKRSAIAAGIVAIILWAIAPALVKVQASLLPITYFLFLRYAMSTVLFVPFLINTDWSKIPRSFALWAGLAVCLSFHLSFQVIALRHLPVSWYIVFFALTPILTLVFLGMRWSWMLAGGFVTAAVGSVFFIESHQLGSLPLWGFLGLLVSMLGWALLTLIIKKLQVGINDMQVTAICNLVSFLVFSVLWVLSGAPQASLNLSDWGIIGTLSMGMPFAFFLFSYSLRHVPVIAVFSQFLEPVFGVLAGLLLFREALSLQQMFGAALILGASYQIINCQSQRGENNVN